MKTTLKHEPYGQGTKVFDGQHSTSDISCSISRADADVHVLQLCRGAKCPKQQQAHINSRLNKNEPGAVEDVDPSMSTSLDFDGEGA